jgi:butyryl-CoA dehydrogenase
MQAYRAPLDDVRFVLRDVLDYDGTVAALPGYEEATLDAAMEVLAEAARLCEEVLLPLNRTGDEEGCVLADGEVRTPAGFRDAYRELAEGGWLALATAAPACLTSSGRRSTRCSARATSASRPTQA